MANRDCMTCKNIGNLAQRRATLSRTCGLDTEYKGRVESRYRQLFHIFTVFQIPTLPPVFLHLRIIPPS